jgi:galactokinase
MLDLFTRLQKNIEQKAQNVFAARFRECSPARILSVPGRVNLIGEHIDYHNLSVLPMAIQRRIAFAFSPRNDRQVQALTPFGETTLDLAPIRMCPSGGWRSYLEAAVEAVRPRWTLHRGIDIAVAADLPPAAGLSSSTALLTGFALALLEVNEIRPTLNELMEILPEGEQFVGTRGGGMDHAAVLTAPEGGALLIHFAPFQFEPVPVPEDSCFLVAHSLTTAEKSGALRSEYNRRRTAGSQALAKLGEVRFAKWGDVYDFARLTSLPKNSSRLTDEERRCFLHVVGEAERVGRGVSALREGNLTAFGEILNASHASLRDLLRVSCPALDELVACALRAGAVGARLTGAGFGGCALALCRSDSVERVRDRIIQTFYARRPEFDPELHIFVAKPSAGALATSAASESLNK